MSASPTSTHRSHSLALASIVLALLSAPAIVVAQGPEHIDPPLDWLRSDGTPTSESGVTPGDSEAMDDIDAQTLSLPPRPGPGPAVTDGIPHIQQDQVSSPEMMDALAAWAFSLPTIAELPSAASLPGARALTLSEDLVANEDAMIVGREFAHIHANPGAGSLHLRLSETDASAVIDAGWGVWHPFALEGSMPGLIMVFAPRDTDDLEVIRLIVGASVEYAGG